MIKRPKPLNYLVSLKGSEQIVQTLQGRINSGKTMAIRIYTTDNPVKAYLVKGLLRAEGVSPVVLDEHFGDYPSVWIQEDIQAEIALKTQMQSAKLLLIHGVAQFIMKKLSIHSPHVGNADQIDPDLILKNR
jgi:Putative prokaryotic signal transducing protein